jgi:hypothetical protein
MEERIEWEAWTKNERCQGCKHLLALDSSDTEYPCDLENHPFACQEEVANEK